MNQEQNKQITSTQIQNESTGNENPTITDTEWQKMSDWVDKTVLEKCQNGQLIIPTKVVKRCCDSDMEDEDSEKVKCQMCDRDIEEDDSYCYWNHECKITIFCGSCFIEWQFCMKKHCDKCMKGDKCISCREITDEEDNENPPKRVKFESKVPE